MSGRRAAAPVGALLASSLEELDAALRGGCRIDVRYGPAPRHQQTPATEITETTPTRGSRRDLEAATAAEVAETSQAAREWRLLAEDHVRLPRAASSVSLARRELGQRPSHHRRRR